MDVRVFEETKVQPTAGFVLAHSCNAASLPSAALRCQALNNSAASIADFVDDGLNGNTDIELMEVK